MERLKLSAFSHEQLWLDLISLEAVRRGAENKAALGVVQGVILRIDCVSAARRLSVKMLTRLSHQRDVHLHQLARECTRWNSD